MTTGEHIGFSDRSPQRLPAPISVLSADLYAYDVTSQSGRPIFEANAPHTLLPLLQKTGISMRTEPAPYPDSRKGRPINRLAYEGIAQRWGDFLNNLAFINEGYFGGSIPQSVTPQDIRTMSEIGMSIPSFLVNRGVNPYGKHGKLPDAAGDMNKINAGVRMAAEGLQERLRALGRDENMAVDPSFFYTFAERTGFLESKTTSQVCAAPQQIMTQAFDALFFQKNADPDAASLKAEIPDFNALQEFSSYLIAVFAASSTFGNRIQAYNETIKTTFLGRAINPAIKTAIEAVLRQYNGDEQKYLALMSSSQTDINRTLGREHANLKPLTTHDITKTGQITPYQVAFNLGVSRRIIDAAREGRT